MDETSRTPLASRGGLKLEAALDAFDISVENLIAADLGSSTGGFVDVLLRRGARRVYAIEGRLTDQLSEGVVTRVVTELRALGINVVKWMASPVRGKQARALEFFLLIRRS